MPKSSLRQRAPKETSCNQLDFDWPQFSQKLQMAESTVATGGYTIGRQSSPESLKQDRLFVPLADEPFNWFSSGQKKWELRRFGRQYTRKHVRVGRCVELRRGYRGPDALWGKIISIVEAQGIEDFFNKVPFQDVIPVAHSRDDAIRIATNILRADSNTCLLGFAIGSL
jgi:ASC-1-like (ASCH) protein